jgi:glycosyltransferase involved in cell wall biosynthesis
VRLVVHDYSGHPFQVQLSRELARRGHDVLHLHSAAYVTGKGAVERLPGDPATFAAESIELDEEFAAYSMTKRPLQERRYAQRLIERVRRFDPHIVISSNTPLFAQWFFQRECRRRGYRFAFWQQDIYSAAMKAFAEERLPVVGRAIGACFVALERRMLRSSDAVVVISDDFLPVLDRWGVRRDRVRVIENWAPLDELPQRPRDNDWARRHGLVGLPVALYSGTLGLKHDPRLLVELARRLDGAGARVVVVSGSPGAQWLRDDVGAAPNLDVLPFQPYADLPDVLGSADVVVAILEADAGAFSVPSKVLSYHCAGRPIVAAVPRENLAARIIERNGSGVVVPPGDAAALGDAVASLLADPDEARATGERARAYAERTFDIAVIGDRFEDVLRLASDGR